MFSCVIALVCLSVCLFNCLCVLWALLPELKWMNEWIRFSIAEKKRLFTQSGWQRSIIYEGRVGVEQHGGRITEVEPDTVIRLTTCRYTKYHWCSTLHWAPKDFVVDEKLTKWQKLAVVKKILIFDEIGEIRDLWQISWSNFHFLTNEK